MSPREQLLRRGMQQSIQCLSQKNKQFPNGVLHILSHQTHPKMYIVAYSNTIPRQIRLKYL